MITRIETVIDKFVGMSSNGYLTISYSNKLISIDFHATEKLKLDVSDDDTYRLYYFNDSRSCPFEIIFKKTDIKQATFYAEKEFSKLPFGEVIEIIFNDGGEVHLFEDVR